MPNEILPKSHVIAILVLFQVGSSLALGVNSKIEQDSWIAILLSMVMFIPAILIYGRIMRLFPGQSLFDILLILFGKIFGRIFIAYIIFYSLFLGSLVLRNFTEFIQLTAMPETPQIPIMILITLVIFYLVKSGASTFGKWTIIVLPAVCFLVLISLVLSFRSMDITNLFPMFNHSPKQVTSSAFDAFVFPFAEVVLVINFANNTNPKDNPYKLFIYGMLISGLILLVAYFRNLTVLGQPLIDDFYFPSYNATRILQIPNILERIESLVATNFILAGIVKAGVCLMSATKGFAKLLAIENPRSLIMPTALIIFTMSFIIVHNTMQMFSSMPKYKFYSLPVQVAIPLLVWIVAEIKNKVKNKKSQKNPTSQSC